MPVALFEKSWPTEPGHGWKLHRLIINHDMNTVKEIWCEVNETPRVTTPTAMTAMKAMKTMKSMNMKMVNTKPMQAMKAKKAMKAMKAMKVTGGRKKKAQDTQ